MSSPFRLADGQAIDIEIDLVDLEREAVLLLRGGTALVKVVDRLGPTIGQQYYEVLTWEPNEHHEDLARPSSWTGTTPYLHARCLLFAKDAYEAKGKRKLTSILDLAGHEEVRNIATYYYQDVIDSGQSSSMILRGVRPIIRILGGNFSRRSAKLIGRLSKTDRRGEWDQLPTEEECLAGAFMEYQTGLAMIAAGRRQRGRTRVRDAVAMGAEICAAWRRSEESAIDVDMVLHDKARASLRVVVPESASKVAKVQLANIDDPRVVEMFLHLIEGKRSGPVFHTNWHKRLSTKEMYRAISRSSRRSLKVSLNFNKARQIAVSSERTLYRQQSRVRHSPGSSVTKAYQKHDDGIGLDEIRAELRRHADDQLEQGPDGWRLSRALGGRRSHPKPS